MKKKRPSKQQLPSSGSSPMFSLRIPADLMKRIEEFAAADALAKGAAIKLLIERGLARRVDRKRHTREVLAQGTVDAVLGVLKS